MNTRILKMCRRSEIKENICYSVPALGQLQPVLFSYEAKSKCFTFRAEDVVLRHGELVPCIAVLDFRHNKTAIRKLFAELETYLANNIESPAARCWREYQERQRSTPHPAAPKKATTAFFETDLFGEPVRTQSSQKKVRS